MFKFLLIPFLSIIFLGNENSSYKKINQKDKLSVIKVFNGLENQKYSLHLVDYINKLANDIFFTDYITSLEFSKKSLSIAEKIDYVKGQAEALHNIGASFNESENYLIGLEQLDKAIVLAQKIDDKFLLGKIYNTKGLLLLNIGYYDDSIYCLNQSLRCLNELSPDNKFIGAVLHNIGFYHNKKGNENLALKALATSADFNERFQNKIWLAQDYYERAFAYKNLANYEFSKAEAIKSIALDSDLDNHVTLVKNLNLLGTIALNFDEVDKAKRLLEKGLNIANEFNLSRERLTIYKSLSKLSEKSKDYKNGFEIEREYNKLYDSLYNKDRYKQLDEFRIYYGAQQKQNENNLLKKANLKKEIKIQNKNYFIFAFVIILILTIYLLWLFFNRGKRVDKSNTFLTKQNGEINKQKKELEELSHWKSKFFSIISHDLRGPILSLKGMLELFENKLLTEDELKFFMKELNKNFGSTANLLDNLLMWSKSQMQGLKLNRKEIDICKISNDNIAVLRSKIDEKKIKLSNEIDFCYAFADEESISVVIRNLIANAIKFSKEGGEIKLSSSKDEESLTFCIKDNGVGMSVEQINKVLNHTFYTTNGTKKEKGSGLGILLCDEFVKKNGGSFWIESIKGKGSSFYFTLPLIKSFSFESK